MALTQVTGPYPIFTDLDGTPLDDGYLYIGEVNDDPETNPIQVYWDANLTIPASQPIRTNSGYAYRNGSPALIYTAGQFSITIRNKREEFVLYSPVGYGFDPAAVSASVVQNDFTGDGVEVNFTLSAAPSTILATNVFINGVYQEKDSYSLFGNVITFSIAPPLSSSIEVMTNETGIINSGNATAISYTLTAPGAIAQTVQTKLEQYVSVKDFGAVGDGVTDDTAAIQAAIDFVFSTGMYGVVTIPSSSGEYIFTEIVNKSKVTLLGTGGVLKFKSGVAIDGATNYYPVGNLVGTECVYDNLIIYGNSANNTAYRVCDSITCTGEGSVVRNCRIIDAVDSGIMFSAATHGQCINNYIDGVRDAGIYINNSSEVSDDIRGAVISNNVIQNCNYGGISIKRSSGYIIVESNTIDNCGNGMTVEEFGTGTGGEPDHLLISNNIIKNIGFNFRGLTPPPSESGLNLQRSTNCVISNNKLVDVSGAIFGLDGAQSCVVSGNIFQGYPSDPLPTGFGNVGIVIRIRDAITPSYNVISNNIISNCYDEGIYFVEGQYNTIQGNIVHDIDVAGTGNQALRLENGADENVVTGNILHGATIDFTVASGSFNNLTAQNKLPNNVGTYNNGIRRSASIGSPLGAIDPYYAGEFFHITTDNQLYFASGTTDADWAELTKPVNVTAAEVASATSSINTNGKYTGRLVLDLTNYILYAATGNLATSAWKRTDGSGTSVTPS
jgi:parallel beta-helix repeat protein